jgi:hypothetical protein
VLIEENLRYAGKYPKDGAFAHPAIGCSNTLPSNGGNLSALYENKT